jgi:hypothetical protein
MLAAWSPQPFYTPETRYARRKREDEPLRSLPCHLAIGCLLRFDKCPFQLSGTFVMVGPRPAGRPWTPAEEAQLRKLIASKVKVVVIAKSLNALRAPYMRG